LTSFLFEALIVTETKFSLSDSWRGSAAAIIGAMQLTITASYFVQWQIFRLKNLETCLEVELQLSKDCP